MQRTVRLTPRAPFPRQTPAGLIRRQQRPFRAPTTSSSSQPTASRSARVGPLSPCDIRHRSADRYGAPAGETAPIAFLRDVEKSYDLCREPLKVSDVCRSVQLEKTSDLPTLLSTADNPDLLSLHGTYSVRFLRTSTSHRLTDSFFSAILTICGSSTWNPCVHLCSVPLRATRLSCRSSYTRSTPRFVSPCHAQDVSPSMADFACECTQGNQLLVTPLEGDFDNMTHRTPWEEKTTNKVTRAPLLSQAHPLNSLPSSLSE
jgi:hypothetical protein